MNQVVVANLYVRLLGLLAPDSLFDDSGVINLWRVERFTKIPSRTRDAYLIVKDNPKRTASKAHTVYEGFPVHALQLSFAEQSMRDFT